MGNFSILLCDSDETYVKRLAAGLQRQLKDRAMIRTCISYKNETEQMQNVNLLVSTQAPERAWCNQHRNCICILLDEGYEHDFDKTPENEVQEGTTFVWTDRIFKYQSISHMVKALAKYLPALRGANAMAGAMEGQTWYGVISPVRHKSMIPFAFSLASQLSDKGRTLVIVFMEFSGIIPLLGIKRSVGSEDFLLALRRQQPEDGMQISLPEVGTIEGVDFMNVTENPMILYEITQEDLRNVIRRIEGCTQYKYVVWVTGNMVQGIVELFSISKKIFSVEEPDAYSRCCQQEFMDFYAKTKADEGKVKSVSLPVLQGTETGEHLLIQWKRSSIGEVARSVLEGEISCGTVDGCYTQTDTESIGYQL